MKFKFARLFHNHGRAVRITLAAVVIAALATAPSYPSARAAQSTAPHPQAKGSAPKPATKPKASPEAAVPFHIGEKLTYRVAWATFSNAATVELAIPEKRELFGWQTWHFQAAIHTVSPVRTLFAIDDQFDSYSDSTTLESRQYESYLNELGKTEKDVLHLIPSGQRPRAPGPAVIVLPGTRDALGMLYALRAADWSKAPALIAPVYDGANLYELHATLENGADAVKLDAGSFTTQRIAIRLFQNGKENPAIHFRLWLATDAARTPVLIAAQLPFGTLRVELTSANLQRADLR
jgi:hypothetical protein